MRKIDDWLMRKVFEPAACEIESWTGITNWQVTRFCILSWLVSDGIWAIGKDVPWAYASFGVSLFGGAIWVGLTFLHERFFKPGKGTANELRHGAHWVWLRCFQLILTVNSILHSILEGALLVTTITSLSIFCMFYFFGIDRLPPKERRLFVPSPELEPGR